MSDKILSDIQQAYTKAVGKHGENHHDYPIWISLMAEELGEAAYEAHQVQWGGASPNKLLLLRGELVDLGQLVYAAVKQIDDRLSDLDNYDL